MQNETSHISHNYIRVLQIKRKTTYSDTSSNRAVQRLERMVQLNNELLKSLKITIVTEENHNNNDIQS